MVRDKYIKMYEELITLRNIISEEDLAKYRGFINKIKEHRYFKVKRRQIDKFEHLLQKSNGYSHNFQKSMVGHPQMQI